MLPHQHASTSVHGTLSAADAKACCDEQVARTAAPLLLVTSGLLAVFTVATLFVTPYPQNVPLATGEAILALAFLGAHATLRQRGRAVAFVHPIFAALVMGAMGSIVLTYAQTGSELLTSGVVLLIVGVGVIALSWPWVIAIVLALTGTWIATLLVFDPPPLWTQPLFTLAAAGMLALMAHAARYRTHIRLEVLRRHDARQRAELEMSLQSLRETEMRLRSVVRAAPVILLATDAAGVVTVAEGRGLAERGWDAEPLVGRHARELLSVLPAEVERMEAALSGEASSGITERDDRVFQTLWSPTFSPSGSVEGSICVATDVTERVRADQEARRAQERDADIAKLQEMDRFKTRILNTASHELNTPLTPIKLQMHLLKTSLSQTDAKQMKAVSVLERNVDRLATLVADIMDVARIQEGELRLAPVETPLDGLLAEAVASHEALAASRKIALDADVPEGISVLADPKRILQILFNLLGNAMKFTPEGGRITLAARDAKDAVEITVTDTGPGMTSEQIGRLFQPFSQVHDMTRTSFGGTGLGLYISRGIAKQHGGDLLCESAGPGMGTSFKLRLPKTAPTLAAPGG